MAGYQTSDEMSGVASKISGEAGPIGDEATAIGKSQVSGADGGRDFGSQASAYATLLRDNVIAGVQAYGTAVGTLSGKLTANHQQYTSAETENSASLQQAGTGA